MTTGREYLQSIIGQLAEIQNWPDEIIEAADVAHELRAVDDIIDSLGTYVGNLKEGLK